MRQVIRFSDLCAAKVVENRAQLRHLQDKHGFPSGFMIGPNSRGWFEDEVDKWLAQRPTGKAPLKGFAKRKVEEAAAR